MYRLLLPLLFLTPFVASAHLPNLPEFSDYEDVEVIAEPQVSQAYYSELTGFPHRYEFTLDSRQEIFVEVLVPDIHEATNDIGGIVVKKKPRGLVEEVSSLIARDASWESFYEPFGGDSYRRGPSFTGEVDAGEYLIEISTAMNTGKYVLVVGEREDFSGVGFFENLKRIYEVKRFFGKPPIAVFQSPFYFVPLLIVVLIGLLVWYRRRKSHA